MNKPRTIEQLISAIKKLPSIGPKAAERLSYHILKMPDNEIAGLLSAITKARESVKLCSNCFNLSETDPCPVCGDSARDNGVLCVVETPQDLIAVSRVKEYNGLYFVLGGALSPLDAIGPKDIRIEQLINKLKKGTISEVILATDTDSKGETTAYYIAEQIKPLKIKVTRLGYGLPVGGDLEYADELTISRAINARREM